MLISKRWTPYVLLVPAIIVLSVTLLLPIVSNIFISLFDWSFLTSGKSFIGLQNYNKLFALGTFHKAFSYSIFFTFFSLILCILVGLVAALYLNTFHFQRIMTALLMLPYMVAPVASGLTWKLIFTRYYGLADYIYTVLTNSNPPMWLNEAVLARWVTIIADVWVSYPFAMLIFLAQLTSIPQEIYEAASVDGASRWQQFKYITFPLLRPAFALVLIFQTIFKLRVYAIPSALTGGGPNFATTSLGMLASNILFKHWQVGLGGALAVVLLIMGGAFILIYMKVIYREVDY